MSAAELKDKIKELRKKSGLTMRQLADAVNVSEATISRWESGNIPNMRRDKIYDLAKALNTTPAYLMGWDEYSEFVQQPNTPDSDLESQRNNHEQDATHHRLQIAARHLEELPEDIREKMISNFEESIDMYLDVLKKKKDSK